MRFRNAFQVTCTVVLVWISLAWSASGATRRVVLLFDERPELPGLALLADGFVRTLVSTSTEPVDVYRQAMDLSRFSSADSPTLLRDFLGKKYAAKNVD